jgi:protein-tyrosine-phosphatase
MKVLFICKANVGRSQMGEIFFKDLAPTHEVSSAGIEVPPGKDGATIESVSESMLRCMDEAGFDIRKNIVNQLTPEMAVEADIIIVLAPEVPDAGGTDDAFHIKVREMIREKVKDLISRLG